MRVFHKIVAKPHFVQIFQFIENPPYTHNVLFVMLKSMYVSVILIINWIECLILLEQLILNIDIYPNISSLHGS